MKPLANADIALFQGVLKTIELPQSFARGPSQSNTATTPVSASPSTPTAALRAAQLANLRALQQNPNPGGNLQDLIPSATDIRTLYASFINAVTATISYHLAAAHQIVPLSTLTFAKIPALADRDNGETTCQDLDPFSLDIYLTTGGSLVISTGVDTRHQLCTLDEGESFAISLPYNKCQVYLAVAGIPAQLCEQYLERDDAKSSLAWKDLITQKLALLGVHLRELDNEVRWVLVRAWLDANYMSPSRDAMADSAIVFYWPESLCLLDKTAIFQQRRTQGFIAAAGEVNDAFEATISHLFSPPSEGGFADPLRFAEEWFLAKPERDKIIEERKRKMRETEMAERHEAGAGLNQPSPFYTRGDLQSAGGVYPTPPDGLPSTSAQLTSDVLVASGPADNSAARPSFDYASGEAMDLDLGAFGENINARGHSIVSRGSLQLDSNMEGMGDDLFGDDEDEFPGHDITDADFSFFDEPDDVGGGTSIAANDPDEGVDPLTVNDSGTLGLKNSVLHAPTTNTPQVRFSDNVETMSEDQDNGPGAVVYETPIRQADSSPPAAEHTIKSPLNPISVRKKLFESGLVEITGSRRRHSTFDAMTFSSVLNKSDAKYALDGTFGFNPSPLHQVQKRDGADQGTNYTLPPRKKQCLPTHTTFPGGQAVILKEKEYDSEGSTVSSDASDDDSLNDFESLSLISSPVKTMYGDRRLNEFQSDEMTSIATSPGNYSILDESSGSGMNGIMMVSRNEASCDMWNNLTTTQDRKDLLISLMNPAKRVHHSPLLRAFKPEPEQSPMVQFNPSVMSPGMMSPPAFVAESALQPSHKDFISVAQIVAEQIVFGLMGMFEPV